MRSLDAVPPAGREVEEISRTKIDLNRPGMLHCIKGDLLLGCEVVEALEGRGGCTGRVLGSISAEIHQLK